MEKVRIVCNDSFHHASHLNSELRPATLWSEPGWNFCFITSYDTYTTFDFATQ